MRGRESQPGIDSAAGRLAIVVALIGGITVLQYAVFRIRVRDAGGTTLGDLITLHVGGVLVGIGAVALLILYRGLRGGASSEATAAGVLGWVLLGAVNARAETICGIDFNEVTFPYLAVTLGLDGSSTNPWFAVYRPDGYCALDVNPLVLGVALLLIAIWLWWSTLPERLRRDRSEPAEGNQGG